MLILAQSQLFCPMLQCVFAQIKHKIDEIHLLAQIRTIYTDLRTFHKYMLNIFVNPKPKTRATPMKSLLLLIITLFSVATLRAQAPKDWAQLERYAPQNAALVSTPEVVFMGNSITDFWINNDAEFFANNNFVDRGISGQTTCEMLVRFRQDVLSLQPQAVVILAGINDIAQNNGRISLEAVADNIISMCELAHAHGIKVVLCSVLPCDRFSWRSERKPAEQVKQLNALLHSYAKAHKIPYVDYHAALATSTGGLPVVLSADGCHPNRDGYVQMESLVVEGIRKALKNKKKYYTSLATQN